MTGLYNLLLVNLALYSTCEYSVTLFSLNQTDNISDLLRSGKTHQGVNETKVFFPWLWRSGTISQFVHFSFVIIFASKVRDNPSGLEHVSRLAHKY
jgi:hypothetical protein